MSYEIISQYITAPHLYENVTEDEVNGLTVAHYMTIVNGVRFVGTYDAVDALADRELIKAIVETPPTDAAPTDTPAA